jgi:hypothetical protein
MKTPGKVRIGVTPLGKGRRQKIALKEEVR